MHERYWQGQPVLVTGATGFIASWMIPALVRRGARVFGLARHWQGRFVHPAISTIVGSVTDAALLRRVIADCGIQTIFHLAGQSLMAEASQFPAETLDVNVRGAWSVLEAARMAGDRHVILTSTSKVYAAAAASPISEDAATHCHHPYGSSKACAEMVAAIYASTYGMPVGIVRCGNLFGGGDQNWSRVIPGLIRSTLIGERFRIRGDGRSLRDYLYIEDAVEGVLRLAEGIARDRRLGGQAFNLGIGRGVSVLELCDTVFRITGRPDLTPVILGAVSDEPPVQYLCPEKARNILNWSPRHSLEDGLTKTVGWYRRNLKEPRAADVTRDHSLEQIGV